MTNKSENPREKLYRKMLHSHWVKIVSALASVVVFCTAYALILPAITMSNQDPKCGIEEHTHIAECYDAEGNIICGLEEHAHSLSCYSDLYAAIEDEGYWSADIPELTGDRNADVLAVAQSQIGYRENDENYLVSENEQTKGYTRYGHWYGEFVDTESERLENGLSYYAYKDWDAMFASFVLYNANIYDMGLDSDAGNWAGALGEAGIYVDAADYVPQIGDLIFYTRNAGENMHVGIVSGVNRGFFGNEIKSISVIAGDSNNEVEEIKVAVAEYTEGDITFETIHGYGVLTPGYGETDESTVSEVQPDDSTVAEVAAEEIAGEDVAVEPAVEEAADASEAEEVVNLDNSADHLIGQNEESLDTVEENTEGSALVESVDGAVSEDGSEIVMNWSLSANLPDATLPAGAIIRVDTASAKVHSMTVDQARAWAETAGTGAEYATFVDNDNYEITFIGDNGLLYSWADVQNMDAAAATSFTGIHVKAVNDVALGEDGAISFNFATTAKVADANVGQNYYVSKVNVNGCAGAATYTFENGKAETVDQNAVLRDAGLDEETAQKTLVSKKSDYTVTMSYGPEAEIPDGSKLYVKEIKQGTEEYNQYIEDAKAALGISEEDAAELLGRFFDIKIMTKDGEFEPKAPVNVNIEYKKAIETEDTSAVSAVHFSKDGAETIPVDAVDVSETDDEVAMVKSVEFSAESFSVYGVVYTVDFSYEGHILHFPGEGKYLLSDVLSELGIGGNIESAELKLIQGEEHTGALYLEEKKGVYWICSDVAFKDTYELDVKIGNKIYSITVTDVSYDMKDAVSSVSAQGLSGDTWKVKAGEQYNLDISFEETPSVVQFPTTGNTLTYQLPNNFKPDGSLTNEPVTLTYTESSVVHTITGCTYSVNQNGLVTITLTDFAKEKLAESGDGKLSIHLSGEFTQDNEHTDFGGGYEKSVTVDHDKDVIINKSGQYNSQDNKVHYTVTVKADGSLTNVHVTDTISGNALEMDTESLTIEGNSSEPTPGSGPRNNGFDLTFPSMKNGETITIRYKANVDWGEIGEGNGTVEQTGNKVRVTTTEKPNPKEVENDLKNRISYNPLYKSPGETQDDPTDPDTKIKPWTITINAQGLKNMKNTVITDHNDSTSVMHYAGDGISIQKYTVDGDGNATPVGEPIVKTWDELEVDPDSASTWSYKITEDGNFKYVISYITKVDVTGKNGDTHVSNHVNDDDGNPSYAQSSVGPGTSKIGVEKKFGTATRDEMTWTITLDVPAGGLNKAIMTDTLPSSGKYQDTLNVESLEVNGLEDGEDYELTQSKGKFKLTFYKDEQHENAGLNGTGRARQIIVTFKTDNDPLWIADRIEDEHTNNVQFQGDNATVTSSDKGKAPDRGIEKSSNGYKTVTIGGEEKVVFEYELHLRGVSDADFADGNKITIKDDYDENTVDFLDLSNSGSIDGLDVSNAQIFRNLNGGEAGSTKVVPEKDNGVLTFTVIKSDLPMSGSDYCKAYKFTYYMVANNSKKLLEDSLKEKDRLLTIGNKAEWNDSKDEEKVDYGYPAVVKENVSPSGVNDPNIKYNSATGKTAFKIVLNPDMKELNGGDPMTLEDVFTGNLSVDYSSIVINVETPTGYEGETPTVTYDYKGNTGTYSIPDGCKVTITYEARVIGKPGETVHFGNKATMNGFTDSANGEAKMEGSAEGSFNIYSIDLFKYSAGHMEVGLNDAVFTLVDENGNPIVYPDVATNGHAGEPITFKTETKNGRDGYVTISLNEQEDGISLQKGITYYLKETVSPSTHAINNTIYRFTISDNPNYTNYEYHSGDILKVYDWPIMGKIEINKEIDGPSNLTEEDKKKIKFEITGTYDGVTPIKVDEWGYAIEKNDLSKYTEEQKANLKDYVVSVTYADFIDDKYTMADLVDGIYTVKETAAALPGYNNVATVSTTYEVDGEGLRKGNDSIAAEEAVVTITGHSKYVMNYKNTYTNRSGGYDLTIKKVDADNNAKSLYGAVFSLEKMGNSGYELVTDGSVDENGNFSIPYENKDTGVTLSGLEPGQYRITEVKAPTNYKATGDGTIEFTIANDGTVTTSSGTNPMTYSYSADASQGSSGTFTIGNDTKHSYTVTKVDGANVSLRLPNAVFGVWESSYTGSGVEAAMKADSEKTTGWLWTYKTDENGRFEIQKEDHDYQDNKIYFFKEIIPPTGYELPTSPAVNYFYFSYPSTPPTNMKPVNLGAISRSQTITNDLPDLLVTKQWKHLTRGEDVTKDEIDVDAIDFEVYQKAIVKSADGGIISEGEEIRFPDNKTIYTIEYVGGNWSSVSIPNAPAIGMDEDGNYIYYTYRIEEIEPEGFVSRVDFNDSGRIATITNNPEPMNITVRKKWETPGNMDPIRDEAKAYFIVYQKNDSGSWSQIPINGKDENELNVNNNWEMAFQVEAGHEYKIVETRSAPNHWPIESFDTKIEHVTDSVSGRELEFTEGGDITITNTYNKPYLSVKKIWDTDSGEGGDLTATVEIYRRLKGSSSAWIKWEDVELNSNNKWAKSYEGSTLPADAADYEYYVKETSVKGNSTNNENVMGSYTVTCSATQENPHVGLGSMSVTNTKYDGEISVRKNWRYTNASSTPRNEDTAKVILQRALADKVGRTVTLNVLLNHYNSWNDSYTPVSMDPVSVIVKDGGSATFNLSNFWNSSSANYSVNNGQTTQLAWSNGSGSISLESISEDTVIDLKVEGSSISSGAINTSTTGKPDIEVSGNYEDVVGTDVLLNSTNNWSYTWKNLPTEAGNNQEYVYSVREIQVNGKMLSKADFVSSVEGGDFQNGTVTVTNTEISYGALEITKNVTVGKTKIASVPQALKKKADGIYTFRIDDSTGKKITTVQIEIVNGVSNSAVVENLPEGDYIVTEIASNNENVTIDQTPKTVHVTGGTDANHVPSDAIATVTNDYDASGTVPFKAKKVFKDESLTGGEFTFTLKEYTDSNFQDLKNGGVNQSKTNDTDGDVQFDDITYSILDAGANAQEPKNFYYIIKEEPGPNPDPSIVYDPTEYKYTVAVYDNGDGTLGYTKTVDPALPVDTPAGYDALFNNERVTKTDFEFKKVWKESNTSNTKMVWPDNKSISVTLYRSATYTSGSTAKTVGERTVGTYSIPIAGDATNKITVTHDQTNQWYVVKFDELNKFVPIELLENPDNTKVEWKYYIKENPLDGLVIEYGDSNGNVASDKNSAENEESVINSPEAYELPSTGGSGITIYRIAGLITIVMALIGIYLNKRRERWYNG